MFARTPVCIRRRSWPSLLVLAALCAAPAVAHDPEENESDEAARERLTFYDEVQVVERADDLLGVARSASEGSTGQADLGRRPVLRTGELAETAPGLIATQHSGGGKANQYFVRGFNLDHGTDLSLSVDGIPVNMPSHGHGQGYADLNFVVPELVERVRFRKGTHWADAGDFSAAGTVDFELVRALPRGTAALTLGSQGHLRALLADTFEVGRGQLTGALELFHHDGPWERPDDYERLNGVARYVAGEPGRGWSLTAMAHSGDWLSTDQVPRRAIEDGEIGRFGLIDFGPRGETERYSVSFGLDRGDADSLTRLDVWGLRYELDLFSNFTYFLDDPADGDQFEQVDRRWAGGVKASQAWLGNVAGRSAQHTLGLDVRFDAIGNGLYRTADLARVSTTRADDIRQWSLGAWAESQARWTPWLRATLGLRADVYLADVDSDTPENSGSRDDARLSPKLSLAFGPWGPMELYVDAGFGYHSNDARGATISVDPVTGDPVDRVEPLVRARGLDVGARFDGPGNLLSTLGVFYIDLGSELVFVGDGGFTEASRPSRRYGVEWTNHVHVGGWLFADFDVAVSHARFSDDDSAGERIPGALEHVIAAAVSLERGAWSGGLRLRYFSDYPLIEDDSVRAGTTALLNGRLAWRLNDRLTLSAEGFNLLDRQDSDIEYYYASRLPGEPAEGVEDVHFHPIESPAFRLGVAVAF